MGNPMGGNPAVKTPKTSPNQFLGGSSMSRLFPEPLNDRMFPGPAAALFQDFLLRPPGGHQQPPMPPIFGGPGGLSLPNTSMQDLSQELDTVAITTKVKEKLSTYNLGQKVRIIKIGRLKFKFLRRPQKPSKCLSMSLLSFACHNSQSI